MDAQVLGRREADERNRFHLPDGLELECLAQLHESRRDRRGHMQARDTAGTASVLEHSGWVTERHRNICLRNLLLPFCAVAGV